jgi:hypothetical protein
MELYKYTFQKEQLQKIPEHELLFFIQLTNFANEIFSLAKMEYYTGGELGDSPLMRIAKNSQSHFYLRLSAGKLWEGWRLIETHFHKSGVAKDYFAQFSTEAQEKYKLLKKYFSKATAIQTIRDGFAFHCGLKSSKGIVDIISDSEQQEYDLYFTNHHGNCFYDMSTSLIMESMFATLSSEDHKVDIHDIIKEITEVRGYYLHFVGECVLVFGKKYLRSPLEIISSCCGNEFL